MPKQISSRKVIWVSMMLALSMAMPALPSQAQWEPQAITEVSCAPGSGTGRITGKVTGDGGVALNNIQVTAFTLWGEQAGSVSTNASGLYTITNLIGNNYLLRFNPRFNPGPYVLEWYGDKFTPVNATPVLVNTGSTVNNINNQLVTGAQIRGTVQGAGAGPLQSVQVRVLDSTGNEVAGAFTTAAGTYTTTPGLAAGTYRVQFEGVSSFLGQVYNGKNTLDTADPVVVAGPGFVNNINATLARGGAITGRVTNAATGLPVASMDVSVFGSEGSGFAFTNASGFYTVTGLASGVYEVQTLDYDDVLIDATQQATVTAPNTTANVNFALAAGGAITGRVTDAANTPLNNVSVYISNDDGSYQNYATTNSSGVYAATGLPTGAFTVFFRPDKFIPEYYNDKPSEFDQADKVNVTAPFTVTNINASLAKGAIISGTVRDALTNATIEGVFVEVLDAAGQRIETDLTDANGRYEMNPTVPTGSYKVRFNADDRNPSCAYVTEYHNDKFTLESADLVAVNASNPLVVNGFLTRGSILFGRVTDALTSAPVTNGIIRVYDATGKDVMFGRLTFLGGYRTGTALPSGAYRAEFTDSDDGGYIDEFWDDKPTLASANSINVIVPNDRGNINFVVAKGGTISGRVIAGDTGLPFTRGSIQVYDANGVQMGYASIQPDGTYAVRNGLPTGSYRVAVMPYGFDRGDVMVMTSFQRAQAIKALEDAQTLQMALEIAPADEQNVEPAMVVQAEEVPEVISLAEPKLPMQAPMPFRVSEGGPITSIYMPTFFGGTVITGPANVAVTSPNNTANIDIVMKRGALIPNVQR